MIESVAVELPESAVVICCDSCSTGCVVKKCKLTKSLTGLILFQESWISLSREDLGARKSSLANDIQAVSVITFLDHDLIAGDFALLHGINYDLLFTRFKSREHESHAEFFTDSILSCVRLGDHAWHESTLLVPHAESLSTDRSTRLGTTALSRQWQHVHIVVFIL